jgi:hypothetical protein
MVTTFTTIRCYVSTIVFLSRPYAKLLLCLYVCLPLNLENLLRHVRSIEVKTPSEQA